VFDEQEIGSFLAQIAAFTSAKIESSNFSIFKEGLKAVVNDSQRLNVLYITTLIFKHRL
jgi:hypothetical protein